MAPRIFISYRRTDAGHAGRLYDVLSARFGNDDVFMDVAALEPGLDYIEQIDSALDGVEIMLALVGPGWLSASDSSGRRRLDDSDDLLRIEIGRALERNIRVIPVLVAGARMPERGDVPDDLRPFVTRQSVELSDGDWRTGAERLAGTLERALGQAQHVPTATELVASLVEELKAHTGEFVVFASSEPPGYFVQFLRNPASVWCEAVSNHFLDAADALSEAQNQQLRDLGWNEPADAESNWWLEVEDQTKWPLEELAAYMVRTLEEVYRVRTGEGFSVTRSWDPSES